MNAIGTNEEGVEVSSFNFEWTLKVKSKNNRTCNKTTN